MPTNQTSVHPSLQGPLKIALPIMALLIGLGAAGALAVKYIDVKDEQKSIANFASGALVFLSLGSVITFVLFNRHLNLRAQNQGNNSRRLQEFDLAAVHLGSSSFNAPPTVVPSLTTASRRSSLASLV